MSLKKKKPLPTQEYLKLVFDYSLLTGELIWRKLKLQDMVKFGWSSRRVNRHNGGWAGKPAGHEFIMSSGKMSRQVRLDGKIYYNHRIIWKWMLNRDPEIIDHEDGDSLNNKWINLRDVINQVNMQNCSRSVNNTSGTTGVSWDKRLKRWQAYIWHDYIKISLGYHINLEDAVSARKDKEIELGFHINHGR